VIQQQTRVVQRRHQGFFRRRVLDLIGVEGRRKRDVTVDVDQPGHQRAAAAVDDPCGLAWQRLTGLRDAFDALATDQQFTRHTLIAACVPKLSADDQDRRRVRWVRHAGRRVR